MQQHLTMARGHYQNVMERRASGKSLRNWERLLLVFFDHDGKPLVGVKFSSTELQQMLGWADNQLYAAVQCLRRRHVPLVTVREEAIGEGEYCLPKTKQEMERAAEERTARIKGGARTHNDIQDALAEDDPSMAARKILALNEDALVTAFGEYGLTLARQLASGEEVDQRALPAASA